MPKVTNEIVGSSDGRPYPCPLECGKFFRTRSDAARHAKRHLSQSEREFKCSDCSFRANQRHGLDCHISSVHLGIRLKCRYSGCTKDFSDPSALSRHQRQTHEQRRRRRQQPKEEKTMGLPLNSEHPKATPPPPDPIRQPVKDCLPATSTQEMWDLNTEAWSGIYDPTPVNASWPPFPSASSTFDDNLWKALDEIFPLDQVIQQLDSGAIPTWNFPFDRGCQSSTSPSSVDVGLIPDVDWCLQTTTGPLAMTSPDSLLPLNRDAALELDNNQYSKNWS